MVWGETNRRSAGAPSERGWIVYSEESQIITLQVDYRYLLPGAESFNVREGKVQEEGR